MVAKNYEPVRYLGEVIRFGKLEFTDEIGVSVRNIFLGTYPTRAKALKDAKKIVKEAKEKGAKRKKKGSKKKK